MVEMGRCLESDHDLCLAIRELEVEAALMIGGDGRVHVYLRKRKDALLSVLLQADRVDRDDVIARLYLLAVGENENRGRRGLGGCLTLDLRVLGFPDNGTFDWRRSSGFVSWLLFGSCPRRRQSGAGIRRDWS